MARMPKPWFDKERRVWKVTIGGRRFNLGKVKKAAMEEFHRLMRQPAKQKRVSSDSLAAVIDAFLEWVHKHRAPDTYEWYRYLLQRFVERYPDMTVSQLKPYHAQEWADSYDNLANVATKSSSLAQAVAFVGHQARLHRTQSDSESGAAGSAAP